MAADDGAACDFTPSDPLPERILEVAREVAAAGGRALVVGGWVRDQLLHQPSKDIDLEIHGLEEAEAEAALARAGRVIHVGKSFGVMRIKGLDADISLPRHAAEATRSFSEASRRRDLTLNSMGWDPLTHELLDPHGGRRDIARGLLRATDARHFGEDPLRALRVAQLGARFELTPDDELVALCREQDLDSVAPERVYDELRKLLMKARRPSLGLAFLRVANLLRFFPELEALCDVPQDPVWHPEGCVWTHTLMVVDEAARLRDEAGEDALALMLGALCHDLGKPATTEVGEDGRVLSLRHDRVGVGVAEAFLARLCAPVALREQVCALVEHHLAPALFDQGGAQPKAYRRLARKLARAGVTMELLELIARADHLGRTTPEALAREHPAMERFLWMLHSLSHEAGPRDVVLGRHVLARGIAAGPGVGEVLERCREVQDETGWTDPEAILNQVLGVGSDGSIETPSDEEDGSGHGT